MRIAITNPTNWPYLRRGVERFINEGATYLTRLGHEVTVVCGTPGKSETIVRDGFTTRYYRRMWHPWFLKIGYLEFHAFFFPALAHLLTHKYDVVLCCTFMDAFAAQIARRFTGTPYVFCAFAIPPPIQYFRTLTLKGAIYKRAIRRADRFVGISNYVLDYFHDRWGANGMRIPVPIDTGHNRLRDSAPSGPPVILCAAAIDDARKGGLVLMNAFNMVKTKWPDAILQITWTIRSEYEQSLLDLVRPEWRKDIHFLGTDVALPPLYRNATVCVLPY
ncbi:MAG: glycosyltransferase family 4 protein [Acidobacteria bacterium]|nr:glycosyltransferase family 4 protein [Acidobacteriota bacterium]